MSKPIVFMFSGQGGQCYQMGRELYETQPVFRHWMQHLDRVAAPKVGGSLLEVLYLEGTDRLKPFDRLLETHPALFMVQYALAMAVMDAGIRPDMVLGASLGETVALSVAGVMPPERSLELIIDQARVIERRGRPGRMMAVLGPRALLDERPEWFQGLELAGTSYADHFIVSGSPEAIQASECRLFDAGISRQVLNVRYAFHSSLVDDLKASLISVFAAADSQPPAIPVISCATAGFFQCATPDYFWRTVRGSIEFSTTLGDLEQAQDSHLIDLGPSGTLCALARQKLRAEARSEVHGVLDFFGRDRPGFEQLLQVFTGSRRD